jgi:ABC-type phosphate transport system permease subunit
VSVSSRAFCSRAARCRSSPRSASSACSVTRRLRFFSEVSVVDFLGDTEWTPLFAEKHFGIWALVSGTVLTSLIAMAVALPFGLLSAHLPLRARARPQRAASSSR